MRIVRPAIAAALLVVALGACDRGYPTESSEFATGSTPSLQAVGALEATFVQQMLPHHETGLAMAELALEPARGASPQVQQLANEIVTGHTSEIGLLTQYAQQWQVPSPPAADRTQVEQLSTVSGAQFDDAWLKAMVAHHKQGIAMAAEAQKASGTPQVVEFAQRMARTQNAQVGVMETML